MKTLDPQIGYPELCRGLPAKLAPGIHFDVTRETYDAIPCLSATVAKQWLRNEATPSVFKYWLDNRWDETPTEALLIGSALDCLRLDGLFSSKFATVPPGAPKRPSKVQVNAKNPSPATLGAIAFWDKFQKENAGKTVLSDDQFERVLGMNKSLDRAKGLSGVFENCRKAVLVGEIDGWACKCEVDLWNENSAHIMDIKTAENVGPAGFYRAIDRFDYLIQATWYLEVARSLGLDKSVFSFIAVGSDEPYPVRVHSFDTADVQHALIHAGTLTRIKAGIRSLTRALTEQDFEDDGDWHLIQFEDWQIARAQRRVE